MSTTTTGAIPASTDRNPGRVAVLAVEPREPEHHEERREDERDPGGDQAPGPGPGAADVHRDLGRVRSRDEVRQADQLGVLGVVDPALCARRGRDASSAMWAAGPPNAVEPRRRK